MDTCFEKVSFSTGQFEASMDMVLSTPNGPGKKPLWSIRASGVLSTGVINGKQSHAGRWNRNEREYNKIIRGTRPKTIQHLGGDVGKTRKNSCLCLFSVDAAKYLILRDLEVYLFHSLKVEHQRLGSPTN